MNYDDLEAAWNVQLALDADDRRTWKEITNRERIEFALSLSTREETPVATIVRGQGGSCRLEFSNGADVLDYVGCSVYLRPTPCGDVEKQEPVAWVTVENGECVTTRSANFSHISDGQYRLYAAPTPCPECEKLKAERDELAAQVEKMRGVLKEYSLKENDGMNGSFRVCCSTRPNEPHDNCECSEALALPDLSTGILNRVRAETLTKKHKMSLQDGSALSVTVNICPDKVSVQKAITESLGYLPGDCSECFWLENGLVNIVIQTSTKLGRIAHEAFHAAVAVAKERNLDPNDYNVIHPNNSDFGYIPAEVCADICEQIVDLLAADMEAGNA